jgi:putative ABC transport system substrate-binding protein
MNCRKSIKSQHHMLVLSLLVVVCVLLSSCAEEKKVYRVGILSGLDAFANTADDFKMGMAELGYIEGKNIIYDIQKVNVDPAGEQRALKKFIDEKVDLIFTFPTSPSVAAKEATKETGIPVVFSNAMIEGNNLVESIPHPGKNITGVRFPSSELTVTRLEFLHQLVPEAKQVYITYDSNYPGISFTVDALRRVAPEIGVTLVEVPVTTLEEIDADLKARSASKDIGIDAILIMPTLFTAGTEGFTVINKFATEHKLAVGGSINENVEMGAVFSYIPHNIDFGRLAAPLADKILKGTPAGTIMVVTPDSQLRINYKVAQELGLEVPEGLLSRADEIIR